MRIVIDMQGAQTESRSRGIGRYTLSFAKAVVQNRGEHEVILALSGMLPASIKSIRSEFHDILPPENIVVWYAPAPVADRFQENDARRKVAEHIREAFLASLYPDVIHISSLFEGYLDDAVTSIHLFDKITPVTVSFYDLIPFLNPDTYLSPTPCYEKHYRKKMDYLKKAESLLTISDFARQELSYIDIKGDRVVNVSAAIEGFFRPLTIQAEVKDKLCKKFGISHPFILYSGGEEERKNFHGMIKAYSALPISLKEKYQLVCIGKYDVEYYRKQAFNEGIKEGELVFTGYVTDKELIQLYNLCDLFVFPSLHEGFGLPALEAMACGAAVISSSTSSLPEVIGFDDALFDPYDVESIASKIFNALTDKSFHTMLREYGLQQKKKFSWSQTAQLAISTWESIRKPKKLKYIEYTNLETRLYRSIVCKAAKMKDAELIALSACLAKNQQQSPLRQLFLDVSEISQRDAGTGIQRVVRSYLKWFLQNPPAGFRVEPVYVASHTGVYQYARCFTQCFLGQKLINLNDDEINWQSGDVFLGLDMQHHVQIAHSHFYQKLRHDGVTVKFLVYDLLPIQYPNLFHDSNTKTTHEQWLAMVALTDGAVCISKATSYALGSWVKENKIEIEEAFQNTWNYIGGNIEASSPTTGLPQNAEITLNTISSRPSFLCVSTIEPRKSQEQVLEAIEHIWSAGYNINLVFVGKQGWKVDALVDKIRSHAELEQRLFWLQGISDEYLEKVYAASSCLIAASLNEGFGLSIIEAARHGIPIIARDIPVFREIAGKHAYYFDGVTPISLANALKEWLGLYNSNLHPQSTEIPWLTWEESAIKLKNLILSKASYKEKRLECSNVKESSQNHSVLFTEEA